MPSDAAIEGRLRELGATVSGWANGPGDRYPAHEHGYDKILVTLEGAITFVLSGDIIDLRAGDRLDLPAGTSHSARVGPDGVRCMEAHLQASPPGRQARRVAGWAFGLDTAGTQPPAETADGTGT